MKVKGGDLTCSRGLMLSGEGWWLINGFHGNSAEMLRSRRRRGPPQHSPVVPVLDHGGGLDAGGSASDMAVSNSMESHGAFQLSHSIPMSHECHQQAGEDVQTIGAIPFPSGGGGSSRRLLVVEAAWAVGPGSRSRSFPFQSDSWKPPW